MTTRLSATVTTATASDSEVCTGTLNAVWLSRSMGSTKRSAAMPV